jgi:hypothetical protein
MKLLDAKTLAKFKSSKRDPDADGNTRQVLAKFFDPCGRGTWYAIEAEAGDDGDWICFGWCVSPLGPDCDEWGYWSMAELAAVRRPFGLRIERDLHLPKGFTVGDARTGYAYLGDERSA